ncbi:hypothetical protein EG240_16065 [Paenimyroides tangerinum]|uniref:Immunity MXAN-0049 protein domain-containing protein n=1 Tax=Paenimyroides tangerinum TaxID=2488728 RepID=A0A3P3VVX3_9FLAO|nr:DUF1629 domain-containing protein [Paenimyroides tangerinum]RRJ86497.1 hypothetical protein EG240_16065 [Paenimyroides tangerinum]
MIYYKIKIKKLYENEMIAPSANGKNVPNNEVYFNKMRKGEIIKDTPVFDYFHLESYDLEQYWEWNLFDACDGIGDYPGNSNWYISNRFKLLFESFKIAPKFHFYETRLLYNGEKLKYWIFQFLAPYRKLNKMEHINFSKSNFSLNKKKYTFSSYSDWSDINEGIYDEYKTDLKLVKVSLMDFFDFIPLNPISSDIICSEKLRRAIEENRITGFEFSELDYEVEVENR